MNDWTQAEVFRASISASASALVLFAVLTVEYDLRYVTGKLRSKTTRLSYVWFLNIFLTLIAMGEGLSFFNIVFDRSPPPTVAACLSDTAWAMLSVFLLIVRPLAHVQILCPVPPGCPQRIEARGGTGETVQDFLPLGMARVFDREGRE